MENSEINEKIHTMEAELQSHEVQCEERWKTNFERLGSIEESVKKIDSRIITVGGALILFLAGLLVKVLAE